MVLHVDEPPEAIPFNLPNASEWETLQATQAALGRQLPRGE